MLWHVDDLKISHTNKDVVSSVIDNLSKRNSKEGASYCEER